MMQITEDTPPDMLAGAMDLTVHLPNGRSVKMSVERSTPMMDLLVQITTAHNLQLSSYILQALEMAPSVGIGDKVLPYKPSTPIGALDTQHIKVVQKNKTISSLKNPAPGHQPFESTFRLKVHLPRNQLYVTRVSPNIYLEEIVGKVCSEKDLDPSKYELRHPGNLDEVLDPNLTLSDYQITEIYVVAKGNGRLTQGFSAGDIMTLKKDEERGKHFQSKSAKVFGLFKRKSTAPNGSVSSSENRSISPSDDSRSVTPPAVQSALQPAATGNDDKPKPPQRKRRPAPKPPQRADEATGGAASKPPSQVSDTSDQPKRENGLLICHSRNSSDSSGYHEASILSDNCTSLPRTRPKTMYEEDARVNGEHSRSVSNLSKMSPHSKSASSLIPGRKKKAAPPPPPPTKSASKDTLELASPVVASQPIETIPESVTTNQTNATPPESPSIQVQADVTPPNNATIKPSVPLKTNAEQSKLNYKEEELKGSTSTPIKQDKKSDDHKNEVDSGICETINLSDAADDVHVKEDTDESEWQYQLPSPPKGFRDASPMNFETETVDSVVTSPELFEKLKQVHDVRSIASDLPSVVSDHEEREMCNVLTLEHLEKRKILVYNRELATSLKYAQEDSDKKKVIDELEDAITNKPLLRNNHNNNNFKSSTLPVDRNLPNFKISTYDGNKEKVSIFEDDTVRSNETCKNLSRNTTSLENISTKKEEEKKEVRGEGSYERSANYTGNVSRSESFSVNSGWSPGNPVKRSKSHVALNKQERNQETLSKSNSLLDGLQSFEVMRKIQTKLSSRENLMEEEPQSSNKPEAKPAVEEELKPLKEIETRPLKEIETKPIMEIETKSQIKEIKPVQETSPPAVTVRSYQSYEPPKINLGTWSQRPKTTVTVKEDADYKLGTGLFNAKLKPTNSTIGKPTTTTFSSYRPLSSEISQTKTGVSIRINGDPKPERTHAGGVVVTTGGDQREAESVTSNFQNDVLRRPYESKCKTRPHSIAFDAHHNDHAKPIVRSVELKKQFQDLPSKSITHISNGVIHIDGPKSLSYADSKTYSSNESLNKPVFRNNSFAPVVKGFRSDSFTGNRSTWTSFGTLSQKIENDSNVTNRNVPFSQLQLRRTESNKIVNNNLNNNNNNNVFNVVLRNSASFKGVKDDLKEMKTPPPLPPAPIVAKPARISSQGDSKELLLEEIRNFGGKKGLKASRT